MHIVYAGAQNTVVGSGHSSKVWTSPNKEPVMPDNAAEVTAAGIARFAGVGRAAVSNWRRRHSDFPRPVGGSVSSPSFALPEVEE